MEPAYHSQNVEKDEFKRQTTFQEVVFIQYLIKNI